MKTKPVETTKNFQQDIEIFDQQPGKTKEVAALKDESDKSDGGKKVAINERIKEKAK